MLFLPASCLAGRIDYKLAVRRLENRQYTSRDFVGLLLLLNTDEDFNGEPSSAQVQEYRSRLLAVLADQNQPQELIKTIFLNDQNNPIFSRLGHGIVRELYDQIRNSPAR